jgi:hypothetical protein
MWNCRKCYLPVYLAPMPLNRTCEKCIDRQDEPLSEKLTIASQQKHIDDLRKQLANLEQQAARMANLPGLPDGWVLGKWTINGRFVYGEDETYGKVMFAHCADYDTADMLLAILNACYPPAPGQEDRPAVRLVLHSRYGSNKTAI